jgi:hypothetical protein
LIPKGVVDPQIRIGVVTTEKLTPAASPAVPAVLPKVKSSGTIGREYDVVSGGELRTSSSALADVTTKPVMPRAKSAVLARVLVPRHRP